MENANQMERKQIVFKAGQLQEFTATRTFELSTFGVKVLKGTDLTFDGSTIQYAGATYQFPQFRSAVSSGWVVPALEYDAANPVYNTPISAGIKLHPPKNGGEPKMAATTVEADERIIMSAKDHAATTRDANRGTRTMVAGDTGVAEVQDGVPVRSLKTPTKSRTSLADAGAAIRAADTVAIDPGPGVTEEQMLSRMSETDREIYLARKHSLKSRYVDDAGSSQGVPVATIKTAVTKEAEGIKLTQKVGGGVEVEDLGGGGGGKAAVSTRVEDGISFTNTNGPKDAPQVHPRTASTTPVMMRDGTADVRLQIARTLCPEFPQSYDFAAPEKKKLARLQADFEDRHDVIRAVFAAESDAFKKTLVDEFPQAFQR